MSKESFWPISRQETWLVEKANVYCGKSGIDKSELTRQALIEYLENHDK